MKKLLCTLLCVMLVVTMMPAMAWAMDEATGSGTNDASVQKEYQLVIHQRTSLTNWLPGWGGNIEVELREKNEQGEWDSATISDYQIGVNAEITRHGEGCTNTDIEAASIFEYDAHNSEGKLYDQEYHYISNGHDISIKVPHECKARCKFSLTAYVLLPEQVEQEVTTIGTDGEPVVSTQTVTIYKAVDNVTATTTVDVVDEVFTIEIVDANFTKNKYALGDIINFTENIIVKKATVSQPEWITVEKPVVKMDYDSSKWEEVTSVVENTEVSSSATEISNLKKLVPYGANVVVTIMATNGKPVASKDFEFKGYDFWAHLNFEETSEDVSIAQSTVTFNLKKSGQLETDKTHSIEFILGEMKDNNQIIAFETQTGLFEYVKNENEVVTGLTLNIAEILKQCTFDNGSFKLGVQINIKNNGVTYTLRKNHMRLNVPDYYIVWDQSDENSTKMFTDQETKKVYFDKSSLNKDEDTTLSFKLGTWNENENCFEPFVDQTGLFTVIKEEHTNKETEEITIKDAIVLNSASIADKLGTDLTNDGEEWFQIQPYATINGLTVPINQRIEYGIYESTANYDFFISDTEYLLPGDNCWIEPEVLCNVTNSTNPDGREYWLKVTGVTSQGDAVEIVPEDGGYTVKAKSLCKDGATVTIAYNDYDGTPKTKNIVVYIVDDIWRCQAKPISRIKAADGKLEISFEANARHIQYRNGYNQETGEAYQVVWSPLKTYNQTVATITATSGKTAAVITDNNLNGEFRLDYRIYEAGVDTTTAAPVYSGGYHFCIDEVFYTFDVTAEKYGQAVDINNIGENFNLNEVITITTKVSKHTIDSEGPSAVSVPGEFDQWYGDEDQRNVINVTEADSGNAKIYTLTRKTEAAADIYIWARCKENGREFENKISFDKITNGPSADTDKFYTYVLEDGKYARLEKDAQEFHEGYPEFFASDSSTNDFYVLYPKVGNAQKPELDVFEVEGFENRMVNEDDLDYDDVLAGITVDKTLNNEIIDGTTYFVWKLTVGPDFEMVKAGLTLSVLEPEDYTHVMFILGDDFYDADEGQFDDGIFAVSKVTPGQSWNSVKDLEKDKNYLAVYNDHDNEYVPEINLNLSQAPSSERNTFYILHRKGTELKVEFSKLHSIEVSNGAGLGGGNAFEQVLNPTERLDIKTVLDADEKPIIVTIGDVEYEATQVNLEKYLGHSDMLLYMVNKANKNERIRARITFGMDVYFEGEVKGVKTAGPVWNVLDRAAGNEPDFPDFEFTEHGKDSRSAYFSEACGIIDEMGQGRVCTLALELNPGYVVTEITTNGTTPQVFLADNSYWYKVYDKNGECLDTKEELNGAGWFSRSSDAEGISYAGTHHRVATYGIDGVGDENITAFKDFLDGVGNYTRDEKYTAKKIGGCTDYNIYFQKSQYAGETEGTTRIVFRIERPDDFRGSKVSIHGNNNIKVDAVEDVDFDNEKGNKNVEQLEGEGLEIKKVYDMTTADEVEGFVCVAISETELDGGNLEDYKVVYFTGNDVPVEMETTHVEGEGIVFTTGHFSTYAVVGKVKEPSYSGGGYIPVAPSTPKDEVTNQAGTTTTAPSTNADLSQSTTSKGNETTTTVDQTIADKIVENAVSNKSEEVVIDATVKTEAADHSTKSATVEVPTETIAQIAEKTEAAVTIKTDVAEIKLDTEALAAVAEQAEGKSVSVVAEKVKADAKEIRVELKVICSEGKTISDFKGGNISVTVEAPKGKKDVVCVYIDEQGHWHTVPGQLNADGTYTFTTGHFSTYAIVDAEHAADTIAAQKEAVKNVQLKIRSANAKTSKGKKAIKLTVSEVTKTGIDFDGYVIYRSTKKTSGFKKIYTTKTGTYFNTSAKKGVKYYYKAKGFVTIDGEKVYTGWSKKAIRTAK